MKNRRMRTRMYGGVRGRKTKKVGRNSKIFVFLLLDCLSKGERIQVFYDSLNMSIHHSLLTSFALQILKIGFVIHKEVLGQYCRT